MPDIAVDEVARIVAGDDGTRYDPVAISLHWITAAIVVLQFGTSQAWGWFGRPAHHLLVVTHMSFGIILTAVIVLRIVWRLLPGHQVPALTSSWAAMAARMIHYLLYALLASSAVLGFLTRWSEGEELSFFGLPIASPLGLTDRAMHAQLLDWHGTVGWTIMIVAFGHAAAALYHHYQLRDRVLQRMLPRRTNKG